jgi:hypothetical protein
VAIQGDFVFVADFQNSLTSVDTTTPTAPLVLSHITDPNLGGFLQDLALSGAFALGADVKFFNGIPITDISNPSNLNARAILKFTQRDDNGMGIAADGSYVYLTTEHSALSKFGSSGDSRLYIGQYRALQDTKGIPPVASITQPTDGSTVIQGSTLPITVNATDDVAVAAVNFLVNGQVVFTSTSAPYQFNLSVPTNISSLKLGATAVDLGGNVGTAPSVSVNVTPDPGTTVTGIVVDMNRTPVVAATVTISGGQTATTLGDGSFSIAGVPTVSGNITVSATALVNGITLRGVSAGVPPVPGGTTNVGTVVVSQAQPVDLVPTSPIFVGNCIPFGNNTTYGFTGFIYRNVPAFHMNVGSHFAFDLGALNDVDIRRNIYFAVANANPAGGGAPQNIRALGWTKVVSDSQTPQNPRGDTIVGNYELIYTAEAPFDFPGGGFIVGFGGSPPGAYADFGCEQVLVGTSSSDISGFFHRRFYIQTDQTLGVLDGSNSDGGSLGGIKINH